MHIELITPEGSAFSGETDSVTLPTGLGEITVLPHHIPIISTVEPGTVIIRNGADEQYFAVARGVVQVEGGMVRVLSDIADRPETMEETAIEIAKKRAEELREQRREDSEDFAEATALLDRELARLLSVRRFRARRRRSI